MTSSRKAEDFLIVGGGIVGLALAYRLLENLPSIGVTLLEKEPECGLHQSTHNSGVLHCGLYYKPGSEKARLAVRGIRQMTAFCKANGIAHEICGKLVVATKDPEVALLDNLFERGTRNGLQGLQRVGRESIPEFEPHAAGLAAIHVPEEGIADYAGVVKALVAAIKAKGAKVVTDAKAVSLKQEGSRWHATTTAGDYYADFLLSAAGLHSDKVCKLGGDDPQSRIVPFRGEYYKIRPERQFLVRNLIYPVPNPNFPFLGVHFTRLIRGGVEAGPNAVLATAREGYSKSAISIRDTLDAITYPGLLRFLARHYRMCAAEFTRSCSKSLFCKALQTLVPEITEADLIPGGSGVRAQAMSAQGSLVDDFKLIQGPNSIHIVNAPSPAATASLAIGEHITSIVAQSLGKSIELATSTN